MNEQMTLPHFSGATYEHELDGVRLNSLITRVYNILRDHEWHTLYELVEKAGGSETGVSAKLRDLRKARFGGHIIDAERVSGGKWRYRLVM